MAELREAFAGNPVSNVKELAGFMSGTSIGAQFYIYKDADGRYFTQVFKTQYFLPLTKLDNGKYVYIKVLKNWNGLYRVNINR